MTTRNPGTTSRRIAIACMLLGSIGAAVRANAQAAPVDEAARLVTAMRLDFSLLDALQWRARLQVPADETAYECLMKQDYRRFNAGLAARVAQRLTHGEMAAAQAFYESPAGRKFTDATFVELHRDADPHSTEDYPDITPDEVAQIKRFIQTAVYPKLKTVLTPLPDDTGAVRAAMQAECAATPVKAPS